MNVMKTLKTRREEAVRAYEQGYADGRAAGVGQAVEFNLYSMIQYLGDKRGWKPARIEEAIRWIHKHAMMIYEELTTFDEVKEAVWEEYGIKFEDGKFKREVRDGE